MKQQETFSVSRSSENSYNPWSATRPASRKTPSVSSNLSNENSNLSVKIQAEEELPQSSTASTVMGQLPPSPKMLEKKDRVIFGVGNGL